MSNWINNKVLKHILLIIFIPLVFYYISSFLISNWQKIGDEDYSLSILPLVASVLSFLIAWANVAFAWSWVSKKINAGLTFKQSFVTTMLPQIGRYIPGKVWTVLGTQYYAEKYGCPRKKSFYLSILNTFGFIFAGILISFFYILYEVNVLGSTSIFIGMGILLIISGIISHPKIFNWLLNYGLRLLKKEEIKIELSHFHFSVFISLQLVSWFFLGAAFCFFSSGVTNVPSVYYLRYWFAYVSANVMGYLAIFVPAGLGVRETVLLTALDKTVSPGHLVVIIFGIRIWSTIVQLIAIGVAAIISKNSDIN